MNRFTQILLGLAFAVGVCAGGPIAVASAQSTPAFTVLKDLNPGPDGSRVLSYTTVGNKAYFDALDSQYHFQLFVTDGTNAGTMQLTTGAHGGDYPNNFTAYNGKLYFDVNGADGSGLWVSNGTVAGTRLLSGTVWLYEYSAAFDGGLYFDGWSAKYGHELWRTDGTTAGTTLVKNIVPGDGESVPQDFAVMNGHLYFEALADNSGNAVDQLWTTDGTTAGTVEVSGMPTIGEDSLVTAHLTSGPELFMEGHDATHGTELFESDGTGAGTHLVKDIYPGTSGSEPNQLTGIGNQLFFDAWTPPAPGADATWYTDGTEAGTIEAQQLLKPAAGPGPSGIEACGTHVFSFVNNKLFDLTPQTGGAWSSRLVTTDVWSFVCTGDELELVKGVQTATSYWIVAFNATSDTLTKIAKVSGKSYSARQPLVYNPTGNYVLGFANVPGVGPEPVVQQLG